MDINIKTVLKDTSIALLTLAISVPLTFNITNNTNNSFKTIIDGEMVTVTAEKYESLIRENANLLNETKTLVDENSELSKENKGLKDELEYNKISQTQETGTVKSNDTDDDNLNSEVPEVSGTDLMDVTTLDGFFVDRFELFEGADNEMYGLALKFMPGNESYITYDLGNNYTTFTAAVMTPKDPPEGAKIAIGIYLDDKFVENYELTYKDRIQKIGPIDVSGAGKMTIRSKDLNNFSSGLCFLVNGSLQ